LNRTLVEMLEDDGQRALYRRNGLAYADTADLYSMPQRAADLILTEQGE
ncbi:glycosyltransferase family 1 protein, partial [Azotobacter chroococcum]|nr:glycosyltransferase family 1 protein [Azotobacter chroococcum]